MKLRDFNQAVTIAKSKAVDLTNVDDSHLHGCALPGFVPVVTNLSAVAKLIRWQCGQLNGQWDMEEMQNMWLIARYRFLAIGEDTVDMKNLLAAAGR